MNSFGIEMKVKELGLQPASAGGNDWKRDRYAYRVKLIKDSQAITIPFFQGVGHTRPPTLADVLECLQADASTTGYSFEEYCSEFGYDTDSRKTYHQWKRGNLVNAKIRALLGDDFEAFRNQDRE